MARQEYEMSQLQYETLLEKIRSVPNLPVVKIGTYWTGGERFDRANKAWDELGDEMGFVGSSARPHGPNPRKFSAIPKTATVYTKPPAPTESERTWPDPVSFTEYVHNAKSDEPIDLPPLKSGGGGDFAGAGASGSWEPPAPSPAPAPSYSDSSSSSDSGSSDSGSSSGGGGSD